MHLLNNEDSRDLRESAVVLPAYQEAWDTFVSSFVIKLPPKEEICTFFYGTLQPSSSDSCGE